MISPAHLQLPRASFFAVARVEPMSAEPGSCSTPSPRHGGLAALPGHGQGEANSLHTALRSLDVNHCLRVGSWSLHGAVWRKA